ncbi:MAG TPA: hypothetical protein VKV39_13065 [Candidatus Sulfotelmatobacter sp.]|nr:hypothetical protein [Candidatus Sulfotelmatobacter sp.]
MQNAKAVLSEHKLTIGCRMAFVCLLLVGLNLASAQSWQQVPNFPGLGAGTALLMTDGSVILEETTGQASQGGYATGNWFHLHPGSNGGYNDGTWSELLPLPFGYAPMYFASAVLPDGRVFVQGGEYNGNNTSTAVDSPLGAIYESANWVPIGAPDGLSRIGDAQSILLPNDPKTGHGRLMVGNCCSQDQNILDLTTLTWTTISPRTKSGKNDKNSEEGWTMLPNGNVFTIDTNSTDIKAAEVFSPSTGKWTRTKDLPLTLIWNCGRNIVPEIGPAVLRPDGTVFAVGANGATAIYNYKTNTWKTGPQMPINSFNPGYDGVADGPAALMPNGHVLVMASDSGACFTPGADFFEFDGSALHSLPKTPNAVNEASYDGRMLVLPSGNILFTDGSNDIEIFTPASGAYKSAWAPAISKYPATMTVGKTYTISGTQFNGMSQGAAYGDDAQMATNFPLVQITFNATGHVTYARTKNLNPGAVATGTKIVSAQFTVVSTETGAAKLRVIANGIASLAMPVTIN